MRTLKRVSASRAVRLVLPLVLLLTASLVLGATPASAESTVSARAGARGRYIPGRGVPVVVTVQADRLIRGIVRVTPDDNDAVIVDVPVEVSAGSAKDVVAVVSSSMPYNGQTPEQSVIVDLIEDDTVVARTTARAKYEEWTESVGVLPQLASQTRVTDAAPLRHGGGTAELLALDRALLEVGPESLGPFATLVASPGDLDALSAPARQAVLTWLAGGGQLYVDTEAGTVSGLPEAWQPRNGWAPAGSGVVRVSHGHAQAGRWSLFLEPTSVGRAAPQPSTRSYDGDGTISSLGRDAGFQVPQLGVMLGLLGLYVLLAGPVNFIVLSRMRRRTLAWATVPALSLLFTGGFVIGGAQTRNKFEGAHATIIEVDPGGAQAHSVSLIGSGSGGHATVRMPAGWTPEREGNDVRYSPGSQSAARVPVRLGADGSIAQLDLSPGQFQTIRTAGPLPGYDTALQVRAATDGRRVTGVVVNNLDVPLHEVAVLVNNTTTLIGTVEAHAERAFSADGVLLEAGTQRNGLLELDYWPTDERNNRYSSYGFTSATAMPANCNPSCPPTLQSPPPVRAVNDNVVNGPLWSSFAGSRPDAIRRTGQVMAVGWTRALPSPLTVEGATPLVKGRTAFVARTDIAPDKLDVIGVRLERLRESDPRPPSDAPAVDAFVTGPLLRLVLPTTVAGQPIDPTQLVLEAPADFHRIAIATADGWRITPEQNQPITYRLTSADVIDGAIYVRLRLPDDLNQQRVNMAGPYRGWRVRTAAPDEPGGVVVTDARLLPRPPRWGEPQPADAAAPTPTEPVAGGAG